MKTKGFFSCMALFFMGLHFTVAQDLTALEGWQIRPDYAFLRTGESKTLQATYCISAKRDNGNGGVLYDCDDDELTPLINDSMVTDWSVNGVLGGNAQFGTVKKSGIGLAEYTAPARKPASETIQVSAVVHPPNTTEKILVVATITILDKARVYYGTVDVHGSFEGLHYSAVGSLVLKETEPNSENFNSVAGSLQVRLTTGDCGTKTGTVPLSGDMTLWKLEIDRSMLVGPAIYGDTYTLAFMPDPFEMSCDGVVVPIDTVVWFMPCSQSTVKSDPDYKTLWGNGTCGDMAISWNLKLQ